MFHNMERGNSCPHRRNAARKLIIAEKLTFISRASHTYKQELSNDFPENSTLSIKSLRNSTNMTIDP